MKDIKLDNQELGQQKDNNFGDVKNALAWLGESSASSGTVYAGVVNSDGSTGTPFPSGWTVSKSLTSVYVITHNLGTNCAVIPASNTPSSIRPVMVLVHGQDTNSFEIRTYQESPTTAGSWPATDIAFHFVVIPQ
jgi:hypothetical protein